MTANCPESVSNPVVPPEDLFAALGNETRINILHALWERLVPGEPLAAGAMTFSELKQAVGVADSGQFNYHLNKLEGRFIERLESGYVLRAPGVSIVRAVLKGQLTEAANLEDEPIDAACPHCGAQVLISYIGDMLYFRCRSCEGSFQRPGIPEGTLTRFPVPPVVLLGRTPNEVFRQATKWSESQQLLMMEGICPECAGRVTTTHEICAEHGTVAAEICERCGSTHPVLFHHICTVCRRAARHTPWIHIFTDPSVQEFYEDRGFASFGPDYFRIWPATIVEQTVAGTDPLEMKIAVDIEGDQLEVILDETGEVTQVNRPPE